MTPSSTSSSEPFSRTAPQRPWVGVLAVMVLLAALGLTGWELMWRRAGFLPGEITDQPTLWALQREQAVGDATVIIGSSRVLFGIDLETWRRETGVKPLQLALPGTSPRKLLHQLAQDGCFRGLVVVGVTEALFFPQDGGYLQNFTENWERRLGPASRWEMALAIRLENQLGYIDRQSPAPNMWRWLPMPQRHGVPPVPGVYKLEVMDADRSTRLWPRVETDARQRDLARAIWRGMSAANAGMPPMSGAAIDKVMAAVKADVAQLQARGGQVVFVRMPSEGPFLAAERGGFPRARFWNRLLAETGAPGIHFEDYPQLQGFELPEWSHLKVAHRAPFTRALAPLVVQAATGRDRALGRGAER